MMTRIITHIGVTPIKSTTLEGLPLGIIEPDIGGGLRGIGKDTTWDGTFDNFSNGICTEHYSGDKGSFSLIGGSNFKAFWFKNTGFKFDDAKPNKIDYDTPVTGKFSIAVGADPVKVICGLYPGEAIVLLRPPQVWFVFGALGTAPAVEWLVLRST